MGLFSRADDKDRYAKDTFKRRGHKDETAAQIEEHLLGSGLPDPATDGTQLVSDSWAFIDEWLEKQHDEDDKFEALAESPSDPDTEEDLKEAMADLGVKLPRAVIRSLLIHDGQETPVASSASNGLIFGYELMGLDKIVQITKAFRRVAAKEAEVAAKKTATESGATKTSSSSSATPVGDPNLMAELPGNKPLEQLEDKYVSNFPKQQSVPAGAVKEVYMNANWIPLVTDNAGNQIGVDLDPAAKGISGQVILYGRDYDTKYVVAENWGEFLAGFVADLKAGNWTTSSSADYEDYELAFAENGRELDYGHALKQRVIKANN